MNTEYLDPIDLSAEAALELAELQEGIREDVPSLTHLVKLIIAIPKQSEHFKGRYGRSMLNNVCAYPIFRDSLKHEQREEWDDLEGFRSYLKRYLENLQTSVSEDNKEGINEAKRFCLELGKNLVSEKMAKIYEHHGHANWQDMRHESGPRLQTEN